MSNVIQMKKQSKGFIKWMQRLQNTKAPWTEDEIIYFRKAIGCFGLKDQNERYELINTFLSVESGYRITAHQDIKGKLYLLNKTLKKNGNFRSNAKLGEFEVNVLKNLSHHMFIGLRSINDNRDFYNNWYLPIYRAIANDGRSFDYVGTQYEQLTVTRGEA